MFLFALITKPRALQQQVQQQAQLISKDSELTAFEFCIRTFCFFILAHQSISVFEKLVRRVVVCIENKIREHKPPQMPTNRKI